MIPAAGGIQAADARKRRVSKTPREEPPNLHQLYIPWAMRRRTSSTERTPNSVSSWSKGRCPPKARLGATIQREALSSDPRVSFARATTVAMRKVLSDSSCVNRDFVASLRLSVRDGMLRRLATCALCKESTSASMVMVEAGSPARTCATRSSAFRMGRVKVLLPPSTSTISAMLMSATWHDYCAIWRNAQGRKYTPPRKFAIALKSFRSEEHTSELQSRQYLVC